MKPAAFDYLRPETPEEALAALAEHGEDAQILAGGQSLMPMLNMRLVMPSLLVDIGRLDALATIRMADCRIEIGAAATQAALEAWPGLAENAPLLALALPSVGHFQTRNRGTVCGSIAHADPSAELPLCLDALDGEVILRSARGRRHLAAADFLTGMLTTAREPDEIVEAVHFPLRTPGAGHAFREVAMRHGDFALVAVAAIATSDRLRIAVGGVEDRPTMRDWPILTGSALDDALAEFARDLDAIGDPVANADYRRRLVRRIGRQVAEEAIGCRQ